MQSRTLLHGFLRVLEERVQKSLSYILAAATYLEALRVSLSLSLSFSINLCLSLSRLRRVVKRILHKVRKEEAEEQEAAYVTGNEESRTRSLFFPTPLCGEPDKGLSSLRGIYLHVSKLNVVFPLSQSTTCIVMTLRHYR